LEVRKLENNTDNFLLRSKQKAFIIEMLSNPSLTVEELCSIGKISPSTYYNWRKDEEFEKEFNKIMEIINYKVADIYSSSLVNIAKWIDSTLNEKDLPVSLQLKICSLITDHVHMVVDNNTFSSHEK